MISHSIRRACAVTLGAVLVAASPSGSVAQDVEMLGARYGTRPPSAYYRERARNPDAYRFSRGRPVRMRAAARAAAVGGSAGSAGPALSLGPRNGVLQGTFSVPVLLGLFSDTPGNGPQPAATFAEAYFADAPGTVRSYYEEVSGGRLTLRGHVTGWARVALTEADVTRQDNGLSGATLGSGGIGNFVYELVRAQPEIDWGLFDNDGPDGIPNSGDDDGFVDALAVVHPTPGAECGGGTDHIWSHKWNLGQALGTAVATPTPAAGGGFIRVDDYFVQPVLSCEGSSLNEIGVFTHEVGHAFGLPDLYDVRGGTNAHAGVGSWDLMAAGSWGCDNHTPESPCHMGAWSKAALGWVDVVPFDPGIDHGSRLLSPVFSSGTVYRIDAQDGSGEYFLLENRWPAGFDTNLHDGGGLLVWQIDPARVANRWGANTVNGSDTPGVRIRQADGRNDLGRPGGGRGDAGDPFPGSTGNRAFHAGSVPVAESYLATPTGLTLLDIAWVGPDLRFDVVTRFTAVTLTAEGSGGASRLFTVDGGTAQPSGSAFEIAPFSTSVVEAAPGDPVEPGVRLGFTGWADGVTTRTRALVVPRADTALAAVYAKREVEVRVALEGAVGGVVAATVEAFPSSPDLWFAEGSEVSVEVRPRNGFRFVEWSGGLAGETNPVFLTLDEPVFTSATLESIYEVPPTGLTLAAAAPTSHPLSVLNATAPVHWSVVEGALPDGLTLRTGGTLTGAALEAGTFEVMVSARDGIGLTAEGTLTIEVRDPDIPLPRAAAPFLQAGPSLTEAEAAFLDRRGNGDGKYDLGDFRAWALGSPVVGGGS